MIWESEYWKDDLKRRAAWLQKRRSQKRWGELSLARLEQCLMLGFYSVRKLIEAKTLSDSTISFQFDLTAYRARGETVTLMNWHKLDELCDLDAPESTSRDVRFVANQLIHSYVFMPTFGEAGTLEGVFVTSDYERNSAVYDVPISQIIRLFILVGADYPNSVRRLLNSTTGDYDVSSQMLTEDCIPTTLLGQSNSEKPKP